MVEKNKFQIIASYNSHEQEIMDVELPLNIKTEEQFIEILLYYFIDDKIDDLIKFSICQFCNKPEDFFVWLNKTNGKYYFTDEDDDTKFWKYFKKRYIKSIS
jgi:hypothetical protein